MKNERRGAHHISAVHGVRIVRNFPSDLSRNKVQLPLAGGGATSSSAPLVIKYRVMIVSHEKLQRVCDPGSNSGPMLTGGSAKMDDTFPRVLCDVIQCRRHSPRRTQNKRGWPAPSHFYYITTHCRPNRISPEESCCCLLCASLAVYVRQLGFFISSAPNTHIELKWNFYLWIEKNNIAYLHLLYVQKVVVVFGRCLFMGFP